MVSRCQASPLAELCHFGSHAAPAALLLGVWRNSSSCPLALEHGHLAACISSPWLATLRLWLKKRLSPCGMAVH